MSECVLNDVSESLERTKTVLSTERQEGQQIQDQLHHANKETERLQRELTRVRRTTEKKVIGFFSKPRSSNFATLLQHLNGDKRM